MGSIAVVVGMILLFGSVISNILIGPQVALFGIGFILVGIFLELQKKPNK